ncbi:hypothetical protein DL93DRAFT_2228189 [Clavulina sp. PMI_390]|nr:hypothetical protein DL93DRAFT_2228189 [Clavulina sp. PMI_390]
MSSEYALILTSVHSFVSAVSYIDTSPVPTKISRDSPNVFFGCSNPLYTASMSGIAADLYGPTPEVSSLRLSPEFFSLPGDEQQNVIEESWIVLHLDSGHPIPSPPSPKILALVQSQVNIAAKTRAIHIATKNKESEFTTISLCTLHETSPLASNTQSAAPDFSKLIHQKVSRFGSGAVAIAPEIRGHIVHRAG